MPATLYLNPATWDLALDANGNVAIATEPYSQAQDAASAILLWQGELWYDTTQGIPYLAKIFGQRPNVSYIKNQLVQAALTVPGVVSAKVFLTSIVDRKIGGQVHVTNSSGQTAAANF